MAGVGRVLLVLGVVSLLGVGACSSRTGEAVSEDSCACSLEESRSARTSLDCYCAEGPCPTYEEAQGLGTGVCSDESWYSTRQEGCGQILIGQNGGLGGVTYVFDATSHELVGVRASTDTSIDECGNAVVVAGEPPSCQEGRVCSRCEGAEQCADACSTEALLKSPAYGAPRFMAVTPYPCQQSSASERFRRSTGCGRIVDRAEGSVVIYDESTHELLGMHHSGDGAELSACGGHWGEPDVECADETSCSWCSEDADACQP